VEKWKIHPTHFTFEDFDISGVNEYIDDTLKQKLEERDFNSYHEENFEQLSITESYNEENLGQLSTT
jgi:hypothetical protein